MAESLLAHQIEQVLELGAWRDEGRLFAVGLNGKVSKHEDAKEYQDGPRQRQGAAASAPSASSSASGTAADPEPGGAKRSEALTEKYLGFRPEILRYYPSARFREVDCGLWITARISPLGPEGPCYWICLFLPDDAALSPKAFAFHRLSPLPRPVGPRHTNFPDGSICAFTDEDDAWRPGDSPKVLLNLYAEWLVCQLFLRIEKRWPGRQDGLDATYRQREFDKREWCHCDSGKPYGACHYESDAAEVEDLKASGSYEPLPDRVVPNTIIRFAKSRWSKLPDLSKLTPHPYTGQRPRG
jgi:hypothetical protein